LMPLFMIYAARVMVAGDESVGSMNRTRWLMLLAIWAFFFGLCVPYFRADYAALL